MTNSNGNGAGHEIGSFLPLPKEVSFSEEFSESASPWLSEYIEFSKYWSPRAFDYFHEACGLWVLSTVCAGRVTVGFGGDRYPSLYIALCSRTSVFAKSTTASIALQTIKAAECDYLLAPDDSTPQRFLHDMTTNLPPDYASLLPDRKARTRRRLAFAGQRGWYYDEFGQHLSAMMKKDGVMSDFRGILRRFDNNDKDTYEYATMSRGIETINRPYLALLASMTPSDLRGLAKTGASMWSDGFWARFSFITPRKDEISFARFPQGDRRIPESLFRRVAVWNKELGIPEVAVDEFENTVTAEDIPIHSCLLDPEVVEAYYRYSETLIRMVQGSQCTDLDGNYSRLPEKAMRVAMLLASFENGNHIEMKHWARGQQCAEHWREGLHALYEQVNDDPEISPAAKKEQKVLKALTKEGKYVPASLVSRHIFGLGAYETELALEGLAKSGEVIRIQYPGKAAYRYGLPGWSMVID